MTSQICINVKLLIDVYKNYANKERLPENSGLDVTFAGSKYNTFLSLTMFYNYGTGGFLNSKQGLETVLNIIRDKYFRLEGNQDFEQ